MGIFDWLFGKKETTSQPEEAEEVKMSKEEKIPYSEISKKNNIVYHNGKKFTGIVQYLGRRESELKDGVAIGMKDYFLDGTVKATHEVINGEMIELKGWIKINDDGDYDENGKKILIREYREGNRLEYFYNGQIKSKYNPTTKEQQQYYDNGQPLIEYIEGNEIEYFYNGKIKSEYNPTTYEKKEYYENGQLKTHKKNESWNEKYDRYEYEIFNCYFESGEVLGKIIKDETFGQIQKWYHLNGNIKEIKINKFEFEFDENGDETTKRYEEELKEEIEFRKHLKLNKFKGEIISKLKERNILTHEIMTKGEFLFEDKEGNYIRIYGQRHTLVSKSQYWESEENDESDGEWIDDDREEIDDFHLTDYEKGFRYDEDDISNHFDLDEWPEWDYNGFSEDWCGIEEEDSEEVRQKKWDKYKSKFPKLTSKEQFDVTS